MAKDFEDFEDDFDDDFDESDDFVESSVSDNFDESSESDDFNDDFADDFDDDFADDFDDDFEDFEDDYEDFDDDFDDDFTDDFDDDFDNLDFKSKEDIDIFDEKPLETDSGYERTAVEVHVSSHLSSRKIVELIETYPSLKRITCSQSIYDRISPSYISALEDLNITVEVKFNWGKKKYDKEEIDSIIDYFNEGKRSEEIASILDMPLSNVNYVKSKYSSRINVKHYSRKYDDECRLKVKSMKEDGLKPKEISKKLNIPVRSVYYILNKK